MQLGSRAKGDEKPRLAAVLLADSLMNPPRFRPFTNEMPKVLLPLATIPMIE